jgi:hypothetical protein
MAAGWRYHLGSGSLGGVRHRRSVRAPPPSSSQAMSSAGSVSLFSDYGPSAGCVNRVRQQPQR